MLQSSPAVRIVGCAHRDNRSWAEHNNMRLVFTPTYASWLNRIEPLFAALRYFALNNSDYQDHEETRRASNAYVAWRNRRPDNAKLRRLENHKPTSGPRHQPAVRAAEDKRPCQFWRARFGSGRAAAARGLDEVLAGIDILAMSKRIRTDWLLAATALWCSCVAIPAQCTRQWQPGPAEPATDGRIHAVMEWDPDGPGPQGNWIVVGGDFTAAGGGGRPGVAAYDPATGVWSSFGAGVPSGRIRALATNAAGELVVGGSFTTVGGAPGNHVLVWRNGAWAAVGNLPFSGGVDALARLPNGNLVAGGYFQGGLAELVGGTFVPIGGGLQMSFPSDASVRGIAIRSNGDLVVSGVFDRAGAVNASFIARWNGSAWSAIGGLSGPTTAMQALANGGVVFASDPGSSHCLLRWNGSLSGFGGALSSGGSLQAIAEMANGDLLVGGEFTSIGGVAANNLARWNGSQWSAVGSGVTGVSPPVQVLCRSASGSTLIGGEFTQAMGNAAANLTRTDGFTRLSVALPTPFGIRTMLATGHASLVAGGTFHSVGNPPMHRIARYDGQRWTALGLGLDGDVHALAIAGNGDLVAGGAFLNAGGMPATGGARWNGIAWSSLGSGLDAPVHALLTLPDGRVLVGGAFLTAGGAPAPRLAHWDGSAWHAFPVSIPGANTVRRLARLLDGRLVAVAADGFGQTSLWLWNGTAWSLLANATGGSVDALAVLNDGRLAVGGDAMVLGGAAVGSVGLWDGTQWTSASLPGRVTDLVVLPNGDWYAVGDLPAPYHDVARRVGTTWSAVVGGLPDPSNRGTLATCAIPLQNGSVVIGGTFERVGTAPASGFAVLRTTCPVTLTGTPSACVGAQPAPVAEVVVAPWLASTYRARVRNLATSSVVVAVLGTTLANQPISALVPFAPPGCTLQPTPTVTALLIANSGAAEHALALPPSLGFLGIWLRHQFAQIEVDTTGAAIGLSMSNTLSSRIGSL